MQRLDATLFTGHLEEEEQVQMIVHKHWLMGLRALFWPTVTFIALWWFLFAAPYLSIFYAIALLNIATLVWWARDFLDYYLDAWIITDQGVIDVEWHGWFHRQSARVLYSDIQGVSYEIQGILGTLLKFGTISMEKISTGSAISMEYVPRPREVEKVILRNMESYLHTKNLKDAKHVQEVLAEVVAREFQLRAFPEREVQEGDRSERAV
jgi:hypothetical protein